MPGMQLREDERHDGNRKNSETESDQREGLRIYLSDGDKADAQGVLLPKKQVPAGTKIGDELEVFLYKGF